MTLVHWHADTDTHFNLNSVQGPKILCILDWKKGGKKDKCLRNVGFPSSSTQTLMHIQTNLTRAYTSDFAYLRMTPKCLPPRQSWEWPQNCFPHLLTPTPTPMPPRVLRTVLFWCLSDTVLASVRSAGWPGCGPVRLPLRWPHLPHLAPSGLQTVRPGHQGGCHLSCHPRWRSGAAHPADYVQVRSQR